MTLHCAGGTVADVPNNSSRCLITLVVAPTPRRAYVSGNAGPPGVTGFLAPNSTTPLRGPWTRVQSTAFGYGMLLAENSSVLTFDQHENENDTESDIGTNNNSNNSDAGTVVRYISLKGVTRNNTNLTETSDV